MLLARETPQLGGDTLFSNMYLAYETLSAGMRACSTGSSWWTARQGRRHAYARGPGPRQRHGRRQPEYMAEHPVVRTHPETGRKSLYVNVGHTLRFRDMTEAESTPILD